MLRPPEACRPLMEYARYLRDYDMQEWGRWTSIGLEGLRLSRLELRETVRALRAARRSEGALLARWGVK